jgi:hypothetical protein
MKKFLAISFIFVLVTSLGLAVVGIVDEEDKDPDMVYATGIPDDIPTSGNQRNRALDDLQTRTNEAIRELVGDKNSKITEEVDEQGRMNLRMQLSNGRNAEIKTMPDRASQTAIERLRINFCSEENNCTIELKEVGSGDKVRAVYEVRAKKESRVLALFKKEMRVSAQIDAETGELVKSKKPWWAFLATE